jgi:hypothetical protein
MTDIDLMTLRLELHDLHVVEIIAFNLIDFNPIDFRRHFAELQLLDTHPLC